MSADVLRQAAALMREEAEKVCRPYGRDEHFKEAVADWLAFVAEGWSVDPGCDLGGGMDGPPCGECFKCAYYDNQHRALAVAAAYLGADQ